MELKEQAALLLLLRSWLELSSKIRGANSLSRGSLIALIELERVSSEFLSLAKVTS